MTESSPITGLHTVGIPVTDPDAALAFYEALGFETRLDVPMGEGARWIEVAPHGAAVSLALERAHAGHPAGVETGIRLTTGDADEANATLRSRGVDADDVLRWPGVPADVRLPRSGRQRARDRRGLSAAGRPRAVVGRHGQGEDAEAGTEQADAGPAVAWRRARRRRGSRRRRRGSSRPCTRC